MDQQITNNIRSTATYNLGGISQIWLLDIRHFGGYRFKDDKLYDQCSVSGIVASSPLLEIQAEEQSNFTETQTNGVYKQKLTTFVRTLTPSNMANLLLANRNKYLILFKTVAGSTFSFGSDGGAILTFSQQVGKMGDLQGYSLTFDKSSAYPLLETEEAPLNNIQYKYTAVYDTETYCCQLHQSQFTGIQVARYAKKETKDGQAVDVEGNLCSQSGRLQAIQILSGTATPTGKYEVEGTYQHTQTSLHDSPIAQYNIGLCTPQRSRTISLSRSQVLMNANKLETTIDLTSLGNWTLVNVPRFVSCRPTSGGTQTRVELLIEKLANASSGQEELVFRNEQGEQVSLIVILTDEDFPWVLNNGKWNAQGFWIESGIWA